ncbi:MAG: SDR family NAD(P)-dependent oxidoreductase, partial [Firmicutes bacterium]|nr:SDR family NAD(P)-dependent oxidoreductase [Bacillota bacterium]
MDFTNQVAISTGAASGMGLLFAENWAELGGNVVMCDVNETVLKEKVENINSKGKGKAIAVICDVRDYTQVCAARDRAVAEFGSIDVMANFAGGTATRMCQVDREKHPEFPDVPIDVYDWGIDVNMKGPFYFAH